MGGERGQARGSLQQSPLRPSALSEQTTSGHRRPRGQKGLGERQGFGGLSPGFTPDHPPLRGLHLGRLCPDPRAGVRGEGPQGPWEERKGSPAPSAPQRPPPH